MHSTGTGGGEVHRVEKVGRYVTDETDVSHAHAHASRPRVGVRSTRRRAWKRNEAMDTMRGVHVGVEDARPFVSPWSDDDDDDDAVHVFLPFVTSRSVRSRGALGCVRALRVACLGCTCRVRLHPSGHVDTSHSTCFGRPHKRTVWSSDADANRCGSAGFQCTALTVPACPGNTSKSAPVSRFHT